MRLTIFGSTGRTGRQVLAEGIRRGHRITAFTRRPDTIADPAALAAVVAGDGRDPDAVRTAVADADAVVAIIAAASRKGPHHVADVARTVTDTMSATGVRRLVVTSVYPIVATKPRLPIALLKLVFADAYADCAAMEDIVSTSSLDWTIARLNRLTDKPPHGTFYTSRALLDRPFAITRTDAAAALLDIVKDETLAKTAINIAGTR
ncbi:Putative NADH-flavin reductase [Micromonospora cremea]|uniref:Putative NADH-flavin reductase n=2 Tax=Micromonospora cremea TaxID=709881 RepID=A0A1N5TKM6_9ACTN|nr:Putative NADH-flavin reductase [Micromonospora cremea]